MTADEFKAKRQALWKSQYHAAEALGVRQGAVSFWERGQRPVPETIVKFLECIEASMKHVAQKSE
jgi:DNA-binding transcriptional regulator YiaG